MRRWRESDRDPFAEMSADPVVMEYYPSVADRSASDADVDRYEAHFEAHGFGLWAVEAPGVAPFIGYVGLSRPTFEAHFMPAVEVGWRLGVRYWGQGYATEAAQAAVDVGFRELGLDEIVSFTVPANFRSRRVMERLGMTHDPADDFDHPRLPEGHRLRRHVLCRLPRPGPRAPSPPAA